LRVSSAIEIRVLHAGDEHVLELAAEGVFDNAIDAQLAREFLSDPRHHIVAAIEDGRAVGFVSAVDYIHPDKPRELWINEVAIAPTHQGGGIGRALLEAMLAHGRALDCCEAWVLTDRSNKIAMRLYSGASGAGTPQDTVMFNFRLGSQNR
jgi:aminoglycoside 6'-N-acetyltransferase I